MASHKSFQDKIFSLLSPLYECERLKDDTKVYDIVGIRPFKTKLIDILVVKHLDDFFQVAARIRTTPSIQKKWNEIDDAGKQEVIKHLEKIYFRHGQELHSDEGFTALVGVRLFQIQNLRNQELLNLVQDDIILLKEVGTILRGIDDSLKIGIPKTKDYDMFK